MTIQCPSPRPPRAAALRLTVLFAAAGLCVWPGSASAQPVDASGVIAGRVTAEHGTVTAFRVKASDTVHRVSYTVFTVNGRYQIFNLPPSTYNVRVVEPGHESEVLTVRVAAGITTTADVAIATTGNVVRGAGTRSTAANRSYGGRETSGIDGAALVDFDTLYPPAPARDVMLRACFGCHGPAGFHTRGPKNEAGWRRAVERMFDPNGRVAQMAPGVPQVSHDTVTPDEKEAVIQLSDSKLRTGLGRTRPGTRPAGSRRDRAVDSRLHPIRAQPPLGPAPGQRPAAGGRHPQRLCEPAATRGHLGVRQPLQLHHPSGYPRARFRGTDDRVLDREP